MKIIVTGSLGHISKPLTTRLVADGHIVTVITSNPENKNDIEALRAVAAVGSLDDAAFLTETFTGADALYAMIPPNYAAPDSREYYKNIGNSYVQAVKASGVKKVVHLSSMGADLDSGTGFILGSHDVEALLDTLEDVSVTHLRPGYFYYNLYNLAGMIKSAGIMGANYGGDDNLVLAHPTDSAEAAAQALTNGAGGNNIQYVVSDERTCADIAKVLGAAVGKPGLQWMTFSDEQAKDGMEKNGLPPHVVQNFVEMGAAIHSGILYKHYEDNPPQTNGAVKLEDFAKEFTSGY